MSRAALPCADRTVRRRALVFIAAVLCAVLCAASANAQLYVFHSKRNDLIPASGPAVIRGTTLVHVGFDAGNFTAQPGDECGPDGGDEICQWGVRFETTGNVRIVDVAWQAGVVEDDAPVSPATTRTGTGGNAAVGQVSRHRIATVSVAGTLGELRVTTPTPLGFLDKDGDVIALDPAGVVVARTPQLGWSALSAKGDNSCGVLTNGELRCVGAGFGAELPPAGAYRQVAVGPDYACALDFTGKAHCWGNIPDPPLPASPYLLLASGDGHMCGLLPDLKAECWGAALADPEGASGGPHRLLSRGGTHVCGLRLDSTIRCWGDDSEGQVSGLTDESQTFIEIAGGAAHSCGIRSDGTLECWGAAISNWGQAAVPLPLQTQAFKDVSAGPRHTCAIRTTGEADCWGDNSDGQTDVPAGVKFESLSLGDTWSCGVVDDGSALCWGTGVSGSTLLPDVPLPQVAAGSGHSCRTGTNGGVACWTSDPTLAAALVGSEPAGVHTQVAADDGYACALSDAGAVDCFGVDVSGRTTPAPGSYTQVATGRAHACGLHPDAGAECWGENGSGEASPPTGSFLKLAAGDGFSCGIRPNLGITCWGSNGSGQSSPPSGTFVDIAAGATHACAVRTTGGIACWGSAGGATLPPAGMFRDVEVAALHSCGIRTQNGVGCFGDDGYGESSPPALDFANIGLGGDAASPTFAHGCGVTTEGSVACWGSDDVAQSSPPFEAEDGISELPDGLEDPIDNCPTAFNPDQLDSDADGTGDACDTCPNLYDPDQYDRDGDGVGDLCDFCPDNAQAWDENDPNHFCEATISIVPNPFITARLRTTDPATEPASLAGRVGSGLRSRLKALVESSSPAPAHAQSGQPGYDIVLSCASKSIRRIKLGLILPQELTQTANLDALDFGPGCSDGRAGGCPTSGSGLHANVDTAESFPLFPAPKYSPHHGGRGDAVYFVFTGKVDPTDGKRRLCQQGEVIDPLASVVLAGFPSDGSNPALSPEGDDDVAGEMVNQGAPFDFSGEPLKDEDDETIPFAQYTFSVGSDDAPIEVGLRPHDDGNPNNPEVAHWEATLDSQFEIHRATLGWIQPTSATAIAMGSFAPNVDAGNSPQSGPGGTAGRADTLYVTFEGEIEGDDPLDPTLVLAGQKVSLGILEVTYPAGTPASVLGEAPSITLEGAANVAQSHTGSPDIFVEPGGTSVASDQAKLTGAGATGEDFDGDGVQNDTDNCVFSFNPDQSNQGGFGTSSADDFGDACQCGDVNRDGAILDDDADVLALRHVVVGNDTSVESSEVCSVADSPDCDMKDVVVLIRALKNLETQPVSAACLRAIPAGGGGDN